MLKAVLLAGILLFTGVESKEKYSVSAAFFETGRLTFELEAKTGIKIRYILDSNIEFSPGYLNKTAGKITGNEIAIFIDRTKNKYYFTQGKNTEEALKRDFLKYAIENELAGSNPDFFDNKVNSLSAILASEIASAKKIKLETLTSVYVKPLNSFVYKATTRGPLSFIIKAFYKNILLFLTLFPLLTWFIFVYAPRMLFSEEAGNKGRKFWKAILFATFCVIIIRIGADYNRLVGAVTATLVLFMPLVAITVAVFRDEIRDGVFRFFGWDEL